MRILLLLFAFITTSAQAQFGNTFLPISTNIKPEVYIVNDTDSIPLAPKEPTTWINIDSNRLIAQAFDTNHKETGYISYYRQSDRYTTRGSVKQAVKALYAFTLREIDFASVYMLFVDAINDDGTIKDQALYYRAVQQMRIIRQRYGT